MQDVILLTGAGQIGLAIARRMGHGKKIVVSDKNINNAQTVTKIMTEAGFDAVAVEADISSRKSILNMIEEVGKVIKAGGTGVTISSQSGHRMAALGAETDEQLAVTPAEELLQLEVLKPANIKDTLHAYQMAKRCNVKRVMAEAIKWGVKGARINSISPGIIVTPLALDEFNGPRGEFYKNMFAKCPAGRPGTADEVANVAELLLSQQGAFITGADFLIDGGATAAYFYGPLKPDK